MPTINPHHPQVGDLVMINFAHSREKGLGIISASYKHVFRYGSAIQDIRDDEYDVLWVRMPGGYQAAQRINLDSIINMRYTYLEWRKNHID